MPLKCTSTVYTRVQAMPSTESVKIDLKSSSNKCFYLESKSVKNVIKYL